MRGLEDLGIWIVIDGDNTFRTVHTGGKLNGAGYAAGDDQLRTDGPAGKPDLVGSISKAILHHGTGKG